MTSDQDQLSSIFLCEHRGSFAESLDIVIVQSDFSYLLAAPIVRHLAAHDDQNNNTQASIALREPCHCSLKLREATYIL